MGLEELGGALNHAPGLLGRVIGPIAIQGQSLEILQDQKGGLPLPPATSHGLALVLMVQTSSWGWRHDTARTMTPAKPSPQGGWP